MSGGTRVSQHVCSIQEDITEEGPHSEEPGHIPQILKTQSNSMPECGGEATLLRIAANAPPVSGPFDLPSWNRPREELPSVLSSGQPEAPIFLNFFQRS